MDLSTVLFAAGLFGLGALLALWAGRWRGQGQARTAVQMALCTVLLFGAALGWEEFRPQIELVLGGPYVYTGEKVDVEAELEARRTGYFARVVGETGMATPPTYEADGVEYTFPRFVYEGRAYTLVFADDTLLGLHDGPLLQFPPDRASLARPDNLKDILAAYEAAVEKLSDRL